MSSSMGGPTPQFGAGTSPVSPPETMSQQSPSSSSSASPRAAGAAAAHHLKPARSCVVCHRRKIRCDRQLPCLSCVRARLACTYPAAEPPARRARKATIADVASRISDLEKTIVAASKEPSVSIPNPVPASAPVPATTGLIALTPHDSPALVTEHSSEEVLVRNGSSSQFFNELLISRVIEEVSDMPLFPSLWRKTVLPSLPTKDQDRSSLLDTPGSSGTQEQDADSVYSLLGIISNPFMFDQNRKSFSLSKRGAMYLWQVFVQFVDPTIKVLHIPTDEVLIFTAIHQPETTPKDVMALLWAVCFSAAMCIDGPEIQNVLGVEKPVAMREFKSRFQQSLAEADMLENPTVLILQALALYLVGISAPCLSLAFETPCLEWWSVANKPCVVKTSTRAKNHGRGIWILNGLAVRMAQSMGLHRDGDKLGLTPFESEVRRRLWWHFIARDSRSAEDHGISSWSTVPPYDTKMPINVEDGALRPEMSELPPPHAGWTRMSLALVNTEVAQTLHHMAHLSAAPTGAVPKEAIRSNMITELRGRVELYIKPCNPVIPLQRLTRQMACAMVHKIDFITRQQLANLENPEKRNSFATEENLTSACICLEIHLDLWADELLRQHGWCFGSHPQYHMLLYVLWHLCVSPFGPSTERAWNVADKMFEMESLRQAEAPALKSVVLRRLKKKAELLRGRSPNSEASNRMSGVEVGQGVGGGGVRSSAESANWNNTEPVDWGNAVQTSLPDWNTLVEDLHVDMHDFSSYF